MNFKEWLRIGNELKSFRLSLMDEVKKYRKKDPEYRWLNRSIDAIDIVRDKLDNYIFTIFNSDDTDLTKVFYGPVSEMTQKEAGN